MKKMPAVIISALLFSCCAFAEEENPLSATLTFTNNYVFRGLSQTTNLPAVQGGVTYTFTNGMYLNLWGSNVKIPDTEAMLEIDTIAGWSKKFFDKFNVDINVARYHYPKARELNYNEINSIFSYEFLFAGLSYSGNVYNVHSSGTYYNIGINYDIPEKYIVIKDVNIKSWVGYYHLPADAGNNYMDYSIGLNKKFGKYGFGVQWTATNGKFNNPPYDGDYIVGTFAIDL